MSRAVFAVMAGLLCTLAGMKYAASLRTDATRLGRWVQVLQQLSLLLEEGTLSIPQAICAAADRHHPVDTLLQSLAAALQKEPLLSLAEAFLRQCGNWTEKPVLERMFTRLGRGSKENRCLAVKQAAAEIELLAQSAAAKADKDVKLWQTLGFIGGMCLTILLL